MISLIVVGVALCPAMLRATLLGTAKNSAKTSMEMIQSTSAPVRIRLIRNFNISGPHFAVVRSKRGSTASRMPSPSRLNARVVITSARLGKARYHQATW